MRWMVFLPVILLILVSTSPLTTSSSHLSPAVAPEAFVSSGLPYVFFNETWSDVLQVTQPSNWSCQSCPFSNLLNINPSEYAALNGALPWNPVSTTDFSVEASTATNVWQNWTTTSLTGPTIASLPSFSVTEGNFYNYTPTLINPEVGGTWTFHGAPYLTLDPSTGSVTGTPINSTAYVNVLSYGTSASNWAQAWWTVPTVDTFPTTIMFNATTDHHQLYITLPTAAVAGVGSDMVWLGKWPLIDFGTGSDSYNFSYSSPGTYSMTWLSGTTTDKTLWYYGIPGTTPVLTMNGYPVSGGVLDSSGFNSTVLTLPAAVTGLSVTGQTPSTITLGWTNPVGADADQIFWGLTCGVWMHTAKVTSAMTYTITGLTPTITYCMAVAAIGYDGGEGPLTDISAATSVLPPAFNLAAVAYGSFVNATWHYTVSPTIPYTSQIVQFGNPCGVVNQSFAVPLPQKYLNVTQPAGSYCVGETMYDGIIGSITIYTNVTVAPVHPPTKVLGVKVVNITSSTTNVTWNATTNTTRYEVLYGLVCGSYPNRVFVGLVTKYNVTGLSPLTTYCLVVEAFNGTSGGPYSNTTKFTTLSTSTTKTPPTCQQNNTCPPTPTPTPTSGISPNVLWAIAVVGSAVIIFVLFAIYGRRRKRAGGL